MDITLVQILRRPLPILDNEVPPGTAPPPIDSEGDSWQPRPAVPAWPCLAWVATESEELAQQPTTAISDGDNWQPPRTSVWPRSRWVATESEVFAQQPTTVLDETDSWQSSASRTWQAPPPVFLDDENIFGSSVIEESDGTITIVVINQARRSIELFDAEELPAAPTIAGEADSFTLPILHRYSWHSGVILGEEALPSPVSVSTTLVPVELGWIAPPVEVSTGANTVVSLAPIEFAWLAPPVTATGDAAATVATAQAWAQPFSVASGAAQTGLSSHGLGWAMPPVATSITQTLVYPWAMAFAKVSAGYVGQPPVPDFVISDQRRVPVYSS